MTELFGKICFAWGIVYSDGRHDGNHTFRPSWELIVEKLTDIRNRERSIALDINETSPNAKGLSLYAENGHYHLIFVDERNGVPRFRLSFDAKRPKGIFEIRGEDCDNRSVFTDYDWVYDIFRQLYETGTIVSPRITAWGGRYE